MINKSSLRIFAGSASKELAADIVSTLGLKLGQIELGKFSDGEIKVKILENVRGHETYVT
jgi:ribose-phosphate pyrophosphokinase